MSDIWVIEADNLKLSETVRSRDPSGGGRPVRKRGYHRALRRKEMWAELERCHRDLLRRFNDEMYGYHILKDLENIHCNDALNGIKELELKTL